MKRVSFSIFSVLSNMESEQDLHTGSDQKVAAPAPQHWPPPEEDRISGPILPVVLVDILMIVVTPSLQYPHGRAFLFFS